MSKRITIPRLGSPRIDEKLIARVREAKARGATDAFTTTGRRGPITVTRHSDADLYQRMMAAKGLLVQVGEG